MLRHGSIKLWLSIDLNQVKTPLVGDKIIYAFLDSKISVDISWA